MLQNVPPFLWKPVVLTVIGGPVVVLYLLTTWAARRGQPRVIAEGQYLLRIALPMRAAAVVVGILFPLWIAFCIVALPAPGGGNNDGLGVLFGFTCLGAGFLFVTHRPFLLVSKTGLTFGGILVRSWYSWEDIAAVSTFSHTNPFVFRARDGAKWMVSILFTGLPELAREVQRRLPPDVYEGAAAAVTKYAAARRPGADQPGPTALDIMLHLLKHLR